MNKLKIFLIINLLYIFCFKINSMEQSSSIKTIDDVLYFCADLIEKIQEKPPVDETRVLYLESYEDAKICEILWAIIKNKIEKDDTICNSVFTLKSFKTYKDIKNNRYVIFGIKLDSSLADERYSVKMFLGNIIKDLKTNWKEVFLDEYPAILYQEKTLVRCCENNWFIFTKQSYSQNILLLECQMIRYLINKLNLNEKIICDTYLVYEDLDVVSVCDTLSKNENNNILGTVYLTIRKDAFKEINEMFGFKIG